MRSVNFEDQRQSAYLQTLPLQGWHNSHNFHHRNFDGLYHPQQLMHMIFFIQDISNSVYICILLYLSKDFSYQTRVTCRRIIVVYFFPLSLRNWVVDADLYKRCRFVYNFNRKGLWYDWVEGGRGYFHEAWNSIFCTVEREITILFSVIRNLSSSRETWREFRETWF
jgi:hypothetical protein